MKIHCFFEQSGTFKNVIKNMGGVAKDYDILDDYGQTDVICDLYDEIEKAYLELTSIFDKIKSDDMIIAFFPCTEFEDQKNMLMLGNANQQQKWTDYKKLNYHLYLHNKLNKNYEIITKLVLVCIRRNIPLIIENPKGTCHYLTRNWSLKPTIIDTNRRDNGDYYKKPTQYWFVNCKPENKMLCEATYSQKETKRIDYVSNKVERSMISKEYANRFIREFIL